MQQVLCANLLQIDDLKMYEVTSEIMHVCIDSDVYKACVFKMNQTQTVWRWSSFLRPWTSAFSTLNSLPITYYKLKWVKFVLYICLTWPWTYPPIISSKNYELRLSLIRGCSYKVAVNFFPLIHMAFCIATSGEMVVRKISMLACLSTLEIICPTHYSLSINETK